MKILPSRPPLTACELEAFHAIEVTRPVCEDQRVMVGVQVLVSKTVIFPEEKPVARWVLVGERESAVMGEEGSWMEWVGVRVGE